MILYELLQDPKDRFREPGLPDQEPGEQEQLCAQQVRGTWPQTPNQGGLMTSRSEIAMKIFRTRGKYFGKGVDILKFW